MDPIVITPAVIDRLRDSIGAAVPQPRTGAAFVNLDTRVLAGLLDAVDDRPRRCTACGERLRFTAWAPCGCAPAFPVDAPKRCGGCGGPISVDRMLGTRCKCAGGDWQPHSGELHRGQR